MLTSYLQNTRATWTNSASRDEFNSFFSPRFPNVASRTARLTYPTPPSVSASVDQTPRLCGERSSDFTGPAGFLLRSSAILGEKLTPSEILEKPHGKSSKNLT